VGGAGRHQEHVVIPTKDQIRAMLTKSAELWPFTRMEMTRTREQKIVAVCWRPLIVTGIFSGLRCSELRGLTWPHVDLDSRVIEVRQRADFQNVMGPPKTAAGYRDVPMAPMVANTLKSWKLACPKTPLDLVFPTKNGTIHSNGNIHKRCWGPLLRSLGIVEVDGRTALTLHSLRHAAASLFIEQKMSPKKVQVVMGHSSIQVTFDIYGHLFSTPDDDQQAMAQIEARLLA
jgi:integrase